ncbi:hypothetical protein LB524_16990 [Mesorhizobium sp. ESP6-5]|uniref:hypothetical protein n=1 Tax=Mesorhizobium sp. ESP6-5 TaxID=2876623 RepID=UPI001CCB4918|nr:hypothetical protein [Mesorhizobium sp. ESP6-5]MBZ9756987.1 hypothetical protein [Mesorhizobium sp. ESP6-5]
MKFSRALWRAGCAVSSAALLSSCAGVPRTDDTTNVSPTLIAAAIQCEMRDAFVDRIQSAIGRIQNKDGTSVNQATVDSLDRNKLAAYVPPGMNRSALSDDQKIEIPARHESDVWYDFLKSGYMRVKIPDPQAPNTGKMVPDNELIDLIKTFSPTFIAYRFKFDITQTDNLDGSFDLLSAVTHGTVKTDVSGSVEGKRQSTDQWVAAVRLDQFLTNVPIIRVCNNLRNHQYSEPRHQLAYPIVGKLGLDYYVNGFVSKNQSGNLIGEIETVELLKPGTADKPPLPTETIDLQFTTTLKGAINPVLKIAPLGATKFSDAMLKGGRQRVDIHSLTIIMQLPNVGNATVSNARSAAERGEARRDFDSGAAEARRALAIHDQNQREDRRDRVLNEIILGN